MLNGLIVLASLVVDPTDDGVNDERKRIQRLGSADFGLRFIYVVLLLSSLSFLGLGVQPPEADWGSLVRENIGGLPYGAPAVIMPALAIASLTIAVNLTIDGLFGRRDGTA